MFFLCKEKIIIEFNNDCIYIPIGAGVFSPTPIRSCGRCWSISVAPPPWVAGYGMLLEVMLPVPAVATPARLFWWFCNNNTCDHEYSTRAHYWYLDKTLDYDHSSMWIHSSAQLIVSNILYRRHISEFQMRHTCIFDFDFAIFFASLVSSISSSGWNQSRKWSK